MNEVSCKVFEVLLRPLTEKHIPLTSIVKGTTVTVTQIKSSKARIDWEQYVAIMRNVRPHFSDEEYRNIGRRYMQSPGMKFAFVIARLLFSPLDMYRWFSKPKQGVGNQMFTCIQPNHRELSPNRIELSLTLPEGFDVCWDFFVISSGNMEELPCLFGLPRAKLDLVRIPQGARMDIEIPVGSPPVFARTWRFLARPFAGRAAARELKDAHESLVERYGELETARNTLDIQATQLRTAKTINDLVQSNLDLDHSMAIVVTALVESADFRFAELRIAAIGDIDERHTAAGKRPETGLLRRTLKGQSGRELGELAVEPRPGADLEERDALLGLVVPTLSLALENALYRVGLERLVEQRTTELESTVGQLREAQGARERFFANISHEIRTPLSIILLAASDVETRSGAMLDARARSGLGAIADAARKLVRLVDELLLLAAGQEGKLQIRPEPSDLSLLIESVVAAWIPMAEGAGLELHATVAPDIAMKIDPIAIERVVTNLVSNAVKYTPRGGSVALELTRDAEHVRIVVRDTGTGIDEDLAKRLFGRFERAQGNERRVSGSGLGLSVAKQLVEAHGGTIEARTPPAGGTEMRVQLPASALVSGSVVLAPRRAEIASSSGPTVVAPSGSTIPARGLSTATILLAEDDVALAEMIASVLSEEFTVVIAHDGLAALELVKKHQPQLLVTDVDMPGIDGIELSRRFREATNDRLAPIIILSAVLDLGTRVAGLDAGATDYVTKPFVPLELLARVRAQLRMRELAVRLHRAEQLSSLGVLTSGLAHELRNPANGVVNAIAPLAKLLPPELQDPNHPVAQLVDVISGCAQQIGTLSRQLLGFRSGTISLELRPANLKDLIQRAISLAQTALTGVVVRTDLRVEGPVQCAPPLLVQVLTNLLENAGHAVGRGGWVEVAGSVAGGRLVIEVSDSGTGVPPELRQRVFEPFFTTKAPGVGTGLGLSVSRDIVHRHGGVLEIRERGGRAVFVVELPMHSGLDATATAV